LPQQLFIFALIIALQFQQPFHHGIGYSANGGVFEGKLHTFEEYIFIGIGIAAAIGGAVIIDVAGIIGGKEGAGFLAGHIIAFFIQLQVPGHKIAFFYIQAFGYPFYIRLLEAGGMVLAAIGALQAVYFTECLFVQFGQCPEHLIEIAFLQQVLVGFLMFSSFFE
jgi:hypothetical protein